MKIKTNIFLVILLTGVIAIAVYFRVLLWEARQVETKKPANSKSPDLPIATVPTIPVTPKATPEKIAPKAVKTYAEAIKASKESGCNIFLYFGAPWCGYCEQMKTTTLIDAEVKEKLAKNFVVLIINTDEDKATAKKFSVSGIPAYMIVNSEGNVVRKTNGYKAKADFLSWLGDK